MRQVRWFSQVRSLDRFDRGASVRGVVATGFFVMIVLVGGCAAPSSPGMIPFGEWSGRGHCVCETWTEGDSSADASESFHYEYRTRMRIAPANLDGRDVIEIEISSDGSTVEPSRAGGTHLKVALEREKRVSEGIVLYRLVGFDVEEDVHAGLKLRYDSDAPPYSASCIRSNGVTILRIQYLGGFSDVMRFERDRVDKTGMLLPEGDSKERGLFHWAETLVRER